MRQGLYAFPEYKGPKIIAKDNLRQRMKPRYSGYFAKGMLAALICFPNQTVAPGTVPPGTPPPKPAPAPSRPVSQPQAPRDWFDQSYQIVTPKTYEAVLTN